MKSLIVKSPHIERILSKEKTWEIRGSRTHIRGEIGLIRSGSGLIVGKAKLADCIGPLSAEELKNNQDKHHADVGNIPYEKVYAWVLENAREIEPIPYKHPTGAIIWVNV